MCKTFTNFLFETIQNYSYNENTVYNRKEATTLHIQIHTLTSQVYSNNQLNKELKIMRKSATPTYEKTTTWNTNLTIGDKLEGTYLRKEEFNGDYGTTVKYVIEGTDGVKYGIYGSASINRQFNQIPEGSYIWIEYTGETTSKNGRIVKTYSIDYDDEYQK